MDKEKSSTTTFNMSLSTLQRIDELLQMIHKYWIVRDLPHIIKATLFQLYKEVYPFLNKAEIIEAEGLWKKIDIIEFIPREDGVRGYNYNSKLKPLMHEFELWLRLKLKEKKLLMAESDIPENALGS